MAMVQTINLVKEYLMGVNTVVKAIDDVNVSIEQGEFLSIMGPSGSGKSTLLHLLGCLDTPTSGKILIDGEDISSLNKKRLPVIRNRKIGFVFQQHHLIPTLDALENVMLPLRYARVAKAEAKDRAKELLCEVGLGDRLHHRPTEMSGGQQQRVAIARALICSPALVLADEPTGALDSGTGRQIIELMKKVNRDRNVTFAIVTHNPEVAESCSRIIKLRDGKVLSDISS